MYLKTTVLSIYNFFLILYIYMDACLKFFFFLYTPILANSKSWFVPDLNGNIFNYTYCWPVLNDSQLDHDFHLLLF